VLHDVWGEAAAGEMQVRWPGLLLTASLYISGLVVWQAAAYSDLPGLQTGAGQPASTRACRHQI
jgi:hypothetical protein